MPQWKMLTRWCHREQKRNQFPRAGLSTLEVGTFSTFFFIRFLITHQKGRHTLDCVRVYRTREETLDFTFHYVPTTQ